MTPILIGTVGVVNDAIEYGVRDCGFSDHPRPFVHGDLTGDEDGLARVALLDDLEQVRAVPRRRSPGQVMPCTVRSGSTLPEKSDRP